MSKNKCDYCKKEMDEFFRRIGLGVFCSEKCLNKAFKKDVGELVK